MLLPLRAALLAVEFAARVPTVVDPATLLDGDLVLHTSRTPQARAIVWATASPYAHIGLIERRGEQLSVLEAVQPVKRTPWSTWQRRGLDERVTVLRHPKLSPAQRHAVVTAAARYLGRPYDLHFAPGDAIGVELGTRTLAADLGLDAAPVQALLRQRWRSHPSCAGARSLAACMPALARLEIVTPVSLRRDPQLTLIASSYPIALR